MSCQNNLKQIGLAVRGYHDAYRRFPVTYIRQDWVTWAVLLLPYLEQENAYRLWDPQLRYYDQPNRGNASLDPTPRNFAVYFCPSRRGPDVGLSVITPPGNSTVTADIPTTTAGATHRPGGLGDYAACHGTDVGS